MINTIKAEKKRKNMQATKPAPVEEPEPPEEAIVYDEDWLDEQIDELLREHNEIVSGIQKDEKAERSGYKQMEIMERPAATVQEDIAGEQEAAVACAPVIDDTQVLSATLGDAFEQIDDDLEEDMDFGAKPAKPGVDIGEMVESIRLTDDDGSTLPSPRNQELSVPSTAQTSSNPYAELEELLAEDEEWEEIVDDIEREEKSDRDLLVNQEKLTRMGMRQSEVQDVQMIQMLEEEDRQAEFEEQRDDLFREEGEERSEIVHQEKLTRGALQQERMADRQLLTLAEDKENRARERRKSIQALDEMLPTLQKQMARTPAQSFASLNTFLKRDQRDVLDEGLLTTIQSKQFIIDNSNMTLPEEDLDDILRDEADERSFITTKEKYEISNIVQDMADERSRIPDGPPGTYAVVPRPPEEKKKKKSAPRVITFAEIPADTKDPENASGGSESLITDFLSEGELSPKGVTFGEISVRESSLALSDGSAPVSPSYANKGERREEPASYTTSGGQSYDVVSAERREEPEMVAPQIEDRYAVSSAAPPQFSAPPPVQYSGPSLVEVEQQAKQKQDYLDSVYQIVRQELQKRSEIEQDEAIAVRAVRTHQLEAVVTRASHRAGNQQLESEENVHREMIAMQAMTNRTDLTNWFTTNCRIIHAISTVQTSESSVRAEIENWEDDVRQHLFRSFLDTQEALFEASASLSNLMQDERYNRTDIRDAEEKEANSIRRFHQDYLQAVASQQVFTRLQTLENSVRGSLLEVEALEWKQICVNERKRRRAWLQFVKDTTTLVEEETIVRQRLTTKLLTDLYVEWLYRPSPRFLKKVAQIEMEEDHQRTKLVKMQNRERWAIMHYCSLMLMQVVEQQDRYRVMKFEHLDWKGVIYEYKHDTVLFPCTPP
eukprot:TRINITY_DN54444_c0_g2_i1.p1 TRINITY_DN54444_c0_g2~~TRINITY_DN54444_c0_g2_i1.p1  ORF type:complete len:950 (-),score=159.23 TRINITY_DN54444_c0_g2_i1:188-2860(-)